MLPTGPCSQGVPYCAAGALGRPNCKGQQALGAGAAAVATYAGATAMPARVPYAIQRELRSCLTTNWCLLWTLLVTGTARIRSGSRRRKQMSSASSAWSAYLRSKAACVELSGARSSCWMSSCAALALLRTRSPQQRWVCRAVRRTAWRHPPRKMATLSMGESRRMTGPILEVRMAPTPCHRLRKSEDQSRDPVRLDCGRAAASGSKKKGVV